MYVHIYKYRYITVEYEIIKKYDMYKSLTRYDHFFIKAKTEQQNNIFADFTSYSLQISVPLCQI